VGGGVSNGRRFLLPAIEGVIYGAITVLRDLPAPKDVHVPFPVSIPFYIYGAIFLEMLLRLVALTVFAWLIGEVILRGRRRGVAFWFAMRLSFYAVWHVAYGSLRHLWL
jgi:hypothetical protein